MQNRHVIIKRNKRFEGPRESGGSVQPGRFAVGRSAESGSTPKIQSALLPSTCHSGTLDWQHQELQQGCSS